MTPFLIIAFIVLVALGMAFYRKPARKVLLADNTSTILEKYVPFYEALDPDGKQRFKEMISTFLGYVRIHGIGTAVNETDKLLVASSAVIPIFAFPEWKYYNLTDVLLYADAFTERGFSMKEKERNVLGMVGEGAMQRVMILSKPSLYQGFENTSGKENVGIHEFVHLLDKEDGSVDGVPEALLSRQYTIPWLQLINDNIQTILSGKSDINVYGATNKAEFFAVAAEYFFERPDLFRQKHPELYELMVDVFRQEPAHA